MEKACLLALLALAACHDVVSVPLAEIGSAEAVLFVVNDLDGRTTSAWAHDQSGPPPPIGLDKNDQVLALLFDTSLASLDLAPGPLVSASVDNGRAIPPGFRAWRTSGGDPGWTAVDESVARTFLADFRLPERASGSCEDGGGCFLRREGIVHCQTPCPTRTEIVEPEAVESADAPVMTPCPASWREVMTPDGITACAPDEPGECPLGEAWFLGDPACAVVGAACPAGGWPEGLPSDRPIAYVRAGATAPGRGTRDEPYATIAAALATEDVIVALAPGTYDENVITTGHVDLIGACAPATILRRTGSPLVWARSGRLRLANLRIEASDEAVYAEPATTTLTIEGVQFVGGVFAVSSGATRTRLEDVDVRRARIRLFEGVGATFNRVNVAQADDTAILLVGATTTATIANTFVADVRQSDASMGYGLWALDGAHVRLDASMFIGAPRNDVAIWDGSTLIARDLVVRGRDGVDEGNAIDIKTAYASIENLYVSHKDRNAVWAFQDSTVELQDAVLHDNGPCVFASEGTAIDVTRLDCRRARRIGVLLKDAAPSHLSHVFIRDVAVDENGSLGEGVLLERCQSTGDHVVIEEATNFGFTLLGAEDRPARADYSHLTVRNTYERTGRGGQVGTAGVGIGIRRHTSAALDHVLVEGNAGEGLTMEADVEPLNTFEDITIRNNAGGAHFFDGHASLRRARLASNTGVTLYAFGARIDAEDIVVHGEGAVGLELIGRALDASDFMETDVALERFLLDAHDTAIIVRRFASFHLDDGTIRETNIAIRVAQPGFDLDLVGPLVAFEENREILVVE